jgi:flagellar M-ring protein FliF
MESKSVTVVDARGNILAGGRPEAEEQFLTASQMEFKTQFERRLEGRVESMLAKVVGPGRAVARVDVDLNMRRVERTRELYDPDKQVVRSERRSKELNESGQAAAGGVPGVQSNVTASEQASPTAQGGDGRSSQKSSRVTETVNYEIDKTIERVIEPTGDLQRISVAVMVDGTYTTPTGGGAAQFQPRSQAEISNFTQLVSAAVGVNPQRGDTIRVVSVPFQTAVPEGGELGVSAQQEFILSLVKYLLGIVALGFIFFFVIRPLLAWVSALELKARPARERMMVGPEGIALPGSVMAALQGPAPEPEKTPQQLEMEEARRLYEEVYSFVSENPEKTADILRGWVKERI